MHDDLRLAPTPNARTSRPLAFAVLALAMLGPITHAQPIEQPTQQPTQQPDTQSVEPAAQPAPPQQAATIDAAIEQMGNLPPELRLGRRVQLLRASQRLISAVVIVESEHAFMEAIGSWRGLIRFPILYDDGTPEATEHIARFVRGFGPDRVIRWTPETENDSDQAVPNADRPARVAAAFSSAYGDPTGLLDPGEAQALASVLKGAGITPAGIVVADPSDDAWLAAAALSIARGQPILWTNLVGTPGGTMPAREFLSLRQRTEQFAERSGLTWRTLGDDIDSITICGEMVTMVSLSDQPPNACAATDLIARRLDDQAERWGWAGQIFGSRSRTVYQAMSALFLEAKDAWLFDGYRNEPGFADYDQTTAQGVYEQVGLSARVTDLPNNSIDAWRINTARGIGAWTRPGEDDSEQQGAGALVASVTTSGNDWFFDLNPGQGYAGDIPLMLTPTATVFVHSWSARRPSNRTTIAGRWLERGAFVYHGSVQEPFLQAFATPAQAASRLAGGAPFGAALQKARPDPWKLAVYGDPLWTFGPGGQRLTIDWDALPQGMPAPMDTGENLDATMRDALGTQDFGTALRSLVLLGRDADAARVVKAMQREVERDAAAQERTGAAPRFDPKTMDATLIAGALVRAGEPGVVIELAASFPHAFADPIARDFVWDAARVELLFGESDLALAVMPSMLRTDSRTSDAIEYAKAIARLRDGRAAVGFLRRIQQDSTDDRDRQRLDQAIRGYGG